MKTDYFGFDDLISIKEATRFCGLSERHIRLLLKQGKIKGKKLGHDWVTTKEFVSEYINTNRKPGRKPKKL